MKQVKCIFTKEAVLLVIYILADIMQTLNASSNSLQGTLSQLGYALSAASSLYEPGNPCIINLRNEKEQIKITK